MSDQMGFPFYCDEAKLAEFLTRWIAIEQEQDRLREDARLLKEEYKDDFPQRAILTAVKVARARRKLADHPKDPMPYAHQSALEALVEAHLFRMDLNRTVPDMTSGLLE